MLVKDVKPGQLFTVKQSGKQFIKLYDQKLRFTHCTCISPYLWIVMEVPVDLEVNNVNNVIENSYHN